MKDTENARKIPSQARSRATLDIILEAAAQLLESVGESGSNTNALAERAGVSIGTLYRYFPDKQSIIAALARQEKAAFEKAVETVLAGETGGLARDRAIIVHGANYADPDFLAREGKLGRSYGCFSVAHTDLPSLRERMGEGRLLFAAA